VVLALLPIGELACAACLIAFIDAWVLLVGFLVGSGVQGNIGLREIFCIGLAYRMDRERLDYCWFRIIFHREMALRIKKIWPLRINFVSLRITRKR
jgi:hypothetical protein